ncbi:MAG: OB-fold nucleic acid binding domain-containing protein [Candidatus Eremiobacterota bacterium]
MFRAFAVLALILGLAALAGAQPKPGRDSIFIVSGTVMSLAESPSGVPLQVEIQPSDGESYIVANDEKGRQLFRFIGDYVVASGIVTLDRDGWKTIHVKSFQVTEEDGTITPNVGIPGNSKP